MFWVAVLVLIVVALIVSLIFKDTKNHPIEEYANTQDEVEKVINTTMATGLSFKEELDKAQKELEVKTKREAEQKAERQKIEDAKRKRQAETAQRKAGMTRRERQPYDSGVVDNSTMYAITQVASEPSYSSGGSCSSGSSSSDSGSSSSSYDSGSSSYSSCD